MSVQLRPLLASTGKQLGGKWQNLEQRVLVRRENGSIYFPPGALQDEEVLRMIGKQFETIVELVNNWIRDGIVKLRC